MDHGVPIRHQKRKSPVLTWPGNHRTPLLHVAYRHSFTDIHLVDSVSPPRTMPAAPALNRNNTGMPHTVPCSLDYVLTGPPLVEPLSESCRKPESWPTTHALTITPHLSRYVHHPCLRVFCITHAPKLGRHFCRTPQCIAHHYVLRWIVGMALHHQRASRDGV